MRIKLQEGGFDVDVAADGMAAFDRLTSAKYDLLLTDLDMPRLDGISLIRKIRERREFDELPILVATGSADAKACAEAFHAGATSFTTKPINWVLLSEQIAYVLRNADREKALREARVAAERATAFRDNLMAVVGHELRTPLNAVIGFSSMIRDEVLGPLGAGEYKDFANEIFDAGQRLHGLVNDALLTSRLITGTHAADLSDNDAQEVLKPIFAKLKAAAACKHQILDTSGVNEDVAVECDAGLFQTAARHLIQNAIDHTPEGTAIWVNCRYDRDRVYLTVDDNGPGIEPEQLEHLSKPLVQGDNGLNRASSGMGFGLAIAKAAAELHEGTLELTIRAEGGLRAALSLPKRRTPRAAVQTAA